MKHQLYFSVALVALSTSTLALAQSTGTVAAEEDIVVTGSATRTPPQGIEVPDTPKARTVLNNEYLRTLNPGQSVLQAINIVPSVNFTNNDPFGSSGGNVRIRGFDGNRISLTFDGLPLNDTGNYAIFSNQQLDPEIIEQVNVNQGTTDVDSPTAASSGGTINYRSLVPSEEYGAIGVGSYGQSYKRRDFYRAFGLIQTGDIMGTGIRAYVAASSTRADKFRGFGSLEKEQYNARIYKGFGTHGDFVSLAGHFNRNRNNSFRAININQANLDFATNGRYTFDNNAFCARPTFVTGTAQSEAATTQPSTVVPTTIVTTAQTGVSTTTADGGTSIISSAGQDTSCTNYSGVRVNPSNTGNARFNSKYTINDKLVFTLDAGYQYTLANGGGFTTLSEQDPRARGYQFGAVTGGVDYSGDTDVADTVAFYTPSNTNTNRYTVLSSLRYDFMEGQSVRVAYAFDYGRHRQTGEYGFLNAIGNPEGLFGGRGDVRTAFDTNGSPLRGRDRFSIAELNQVSGEYRGKFLDNKLEVLLGVRAPFFHRELNQFCYTQATTGNPICTGRSFGTTPVVIPAGGNALNFLYVIPGSALPNAQPANAIYAPFKSTYNYRKVLPNVGITLKPVDNVSIYASYARGLSAPRTDNLYRAPNVVVAPETTDNFDAGIRYTSGIVRASFGGFYNKFQNRIVTAFDPLQGISIDRNVGRVEIKGLEGSLNIRPVKWFSINAFGSYIDARYKDDVATTVNGVSFNIPLANKRLVETPEWQYGARAQAKYGPASVALNYKHVTSRFATDLNDERVPGYSVFDADVRVSLDTLGLKKTFFQLNVTNLFDRKYLGSINSQPSLPTNVAGLIPGLATTQNIGGGTPTYQVGSPRAIVGSLQVGF